MRMTKGINGKIFGRALSYALKACPRGDAAPQLQHIAIIGNRVIGADGRRWHVGLLPPGIAAAPMVVTRGCALGLIRALRYAHGETKVKGEFTVTFSGELCVIEFGARYPIERAWEMAPHGVGDLPARWEDPVPHTAPVHTGGRDEYPADHMQAANEWYKSWEKHYGTAVMRSHGTGAPLRIDVTSGGEAVVTAFILPADVPSAVLPADEPLLKGKGEARSQTVLDLQLVGDRPLAGDAEAPPAEAPPPASKGKKKSRLRAVPPPAPEAEE